MHALSHALCSVMRILASGYLSGRCQDTQNPKRLLLPNQNPKAKS